MGFFGQPRPLSRVNLDALTGCGEQSSVSATLVAFRLRRRRGAVRKPSLAVLFVFWTAVALAEQGVSSPAARHTVVVDARPNPAAAPAVALTADDVRAVIQSAVQQASALGRPAVIAVVDRETNVLAVYRMDGAPRSLHFSGR